MVEYCVRDSFAQTLLYQTAHRRGTLHASLTGKEIIMTWRDKLEIRLKENAAFRKAKLPASPVRGPEIPTGPGRSAEIAMAREDGAPVAQPIGRAEDEQRRGWLRDGLSAGERVLRLRRWLTRALHS
jgi:hypothetical protein